MSYNRFLELSRRVIMPFYILKNLFSGHCTGISFVDYTPIRVCKNKRIKTGKVFENSRSWKIDHGLVLRLQAPFAY